MSPETLNLLLFPICGAIGGIIGCAAKHEKLELPRIVVIREADGETRRFIHPGFLASVLAGAVGAFIIDHRPETAIVYGLAAGFVGPAILKAFIAPALRKLGWSEDAAALSAVGATPERQP